jgi:hypothetical protein
MKRHLLRLAQLTVVSMWVVGGVSGCGKQVQQTERSQNPSSSEAVVNKELRGTTEPVEQDRSALDPVLLQAVETEEGSNYDRVVFVFQGPSVPGYRVAYAQIPVEQCGSGDVLTVDGEKQLLVRLSPAQAHTEAGTATIQQPERHVNMRIVKELELSCDFEGEVSWVLGLSMQNKYQVSELSGPSRLVVDIEH